MTRNIFGLRYRLLLVVARVHIVWRRGSVGELLCFIAANAADRIE